MTAYHERSLDLEKQAWLVLLTDSDDEQLLMMT